MTRLARRLKGYTAITAITTAAFTFGANADFVINDDLIVDGSACIGFDCVNGESFSFDTIRLKENNLRIKFDDTSVAAGFPSTDWQITANASANGGQAKFSIDDISGNRTPFTIEANARSHSLYVDDGGRIGIRTSTPSTELHIIDGDTPTVRLQQDGSSGFAPQTWDVAGNETNFFIRDVTNGSTLPFRIRPGAPTSSIFIDVDGDVGMGTTSPDGHLDIESGSDSTVLALTQTGAVSAKWEMTNNSNTGRLVFGVDGGTDPFKMASTAVENLLRVGIVANDQIDVAGNMILTGTITTSGSCSVGCDRVFDDDYDMPTIAQHASYMWENRHLPAVGPTPEKGPMNLSQKVGGILNELEKAHIYIEQLHKRVERTEQLELAVADLRTRLDELMAKK